MLALEKNGKVRIEPFSDVISVENSHLARVFQPGGAHHANVHPRDRQNAGAAPGRCRDRTDRVAHASGLRILGLQAGRMRHFFGRQKFSEMFGYTDRSYTRAAAAVWDAKRLVQIQMT